MLKIPKVLKRHKGKIAILSVVLLLVGGLTRLETIGVFNNIWQFNYHMAGITISNDLGSHTFSSLSDTIPPSTITSWYVDHDGPLSVHNLGMACGIRTDVSLLGRVDASGNPLAYDANDSAQVTYIEDGIIYYKFSYRFEVKIETVQQYFDGNIGGVPTFFPEFGSWQVQARIQLNLQKSIFNNNISAYFADAYIGETDQTVLGSYDWWQTPEIIRAHDPGSAIPIMDVVTNEYGHESAIIEIGATKLKPGVVELSTPGDVRRGNYAVWVTYKIVVNILAAKPVVVGDETDLVPFQPPVYPGGPPGGLPPGSPNDTLILLAVIVVIVVVIYYLCVRRKPSSGSVVVLKG